VREVRRLHRQVPLLPRHLRSEKHAGGAPGPAAQVYRRYYTFAGKFFPKLVGARDMTKDVLDEWYNYFHQCSQCRRCSVYCPYGIDTAEISMAAREVMDSVGLGQKYTNEILVKVHKIGNNLGLPGRH
jgi:Fe-S oxidoreductase